MSNTKSHFDWYVFLAVSFLMLFSVAFVYSASAYTAEYRFGGADKLFLNHSIRVLIGFGIMIFFASVNYQIWQKLSKPIMYIAIFLLILVLISGTEIKGATRWISLGPLNLQPSEIAKFAIIVHFANLLANKQQTIKDFQKGFLPFLLWSGGICLLIALQPNFSTMMVIFMISFTLMFVGNTNILHLGATFLGGFILAIFYAVSAEYRLNRLLAYLGWGDETTVVENVSYQLNQSLLALGNGGIIGTGVGQNRQSYFLPESYGDFIFSIIGEEFGFIGLLLLMGIFVFIIWRGYFIARKAPDAYGYYLAIGIIITIAIYTTVNAGVNTGLLPTTGVPMPFVSYGGTAIFIYSGLIGILLNVSKQAGVYQNPNEVDIQNNDDLPEEDQIS